MCSSSIKRRVNKKLSKKLFPKRNLGPLESTETVVTRDVFYTLFSYHYNSLTVSLDTRQKITPNLLVLLADPLSFGLTMVHRFNHCETPDP